MPFLLVVLLAISFSVLFVLHSALCLYSSMCSQSCRCYSSALYLVVFTRQSAAQLVVFISRSALYHVVFIRPLLFIYVLVFV